MPGIVAGHRAASGLLISTVYTAAIFLSAALIFWLQPMVPKAILPLMGGTPATWVTALMFYQAILFLGYAYCFALTRWAPHWAQAVVHVAVLGVAGFYLPPALPEPSLALGQMPATQVVYMLTLAVGAPLFALSATAPLLQYWFSRTGHVHAHDPYFLYAASNVGGIGALLAYPSLIEPQIGLHDQAVIWTAGFVLFAVTIVGCIVLTRRPADAVRTSAEPVTAGSEPKASAWMWLLLAAVPSSLLSGTTTRITTDIAAGPLFWVVPLALYLLTFVLAFARRRVLPLKWVMLLQPVALVPVVAAAFGGEELLGGWTVLGFTILLLFLSAYICHVRLVDSRPGVARATEFYLMISLGGLLGGTFNALVAPNLFNDVYEFPLALVLAVLLRPKDPEAKSAGLVRDLIPPMLIGAAATIVIVASPLDRLQLTAGLTGLALAVALVLLAGVPRRFAAGVAATFLVAQLPAVIDPPLDQVRNFFGVVRVIHDRPHDMNIFVSGGTNHGAQLRDPAQRRRMITYYGEGGPYSQVIAMRQRHNTTGAVAVLGLGAGSVACSGFPDAHWTFYEINPAVVRIAQDPRFFSFLADCQPDGPVKIGDGRLLLEQEPGKFDLILLDAFTADSVPMHLMTQEAFASYLERLAPNGIIVINISNKFVNLEPLVSAVARTYGLAAVSRFDDTTSLYKTSSKWVVMAREPVNVAPLLKREGWKPVALTDVGPWTDDRSSLFRHLLPVR